MTQNPLLDYSGMPEFSAIKPEHVKEAVTIAINKCRQVIEEVSSKYKEDPTWDNSMVCSLSFKFCK